MIQPAQGPDGRQYWPQVRSLSPSFASVNGWPVARGLISLCRRVCAVDRTGRLPAASRSAKDAGLRVPAQGPPHQLSPTHRIEEGDNKPRRRRSDKTGNDSRSLDLSPCACAVVRVRVRCEVAMMDVRTEGSELPRDVPRARMRRMRRSLVAP